jgi:protein-S-isoprenylcysteine O-methyltransferase Ste14
MRSVLGRTGQSRRARTRAAAIGSAIFFFLAPGLVAGVIPWWLTRWQLRQPLFDGTLTRWIGAILIVIGALVLISAFIRFVVEGVGTPAPVAPTERLVVGGLYRYVRNPMYLAVIAIIAGQAFVLGQRPLVTYALLVWVLFAAFVKVYEEPTLRRRYGAQYDGYCRSVRGWIPRLRPWTDERESGTAR